MFNPFSFLKTRTILAYSGRYSTLKQHLMQRDFKAFSGQPIVPSKLEKALRTQAIESL